MADRDRAHDLIKQGIHRACDRRAQKRVTSKNAATTFEPVAQTVERPESRRMERLLPPHRRLGEEQQYRGCTWIAGLSRLPPRLLMHWESGCWRHRLDCRQLWLWPWCLADALYRQPVLIHQHVMGFRSLWMSPLVRACCIARRPPRTAAVASRSIRKGAAAQEMRQPRAAG